MHGIGITVGFEKFAEFEKALGDYTGAPHVVLTDCCTHAVELCLRMQKVSIVNLPYRSYISIPMTMHKLNIDYRYDKVEWTHEYRIGLTNVWDSARGLDSDMYRAGQFQCLSEVDR